MKLSGPSQIFLAIGLVSVIISSFGGLNQSNSKVLLSFSGLGHFGLIFRRLFMDPPGLGKDPKNHVKK